MIDADEMLSRLDVSAEWTPNWADVVGRSKPPTVRRGLLPSRLPRRLTLAITAIVAVLVPLVAISATQSWWFETGPAPAPSPRVGPTVVTSGTWGGQPWTLVAYISDTDGLCYSVTSGADTGQNALGALACAPFRGVPRTSQTKASPDMTIGVLVGRLEQLPPFVVGPVISDAARVRIEFASGGSLTVPTVSAPAALGDLRFYAAELPVADAGDSPAWVAGLNEAGDVIACDAPATSNDGVSPLSSCGS